MLSLADMGGLDDDDLMSLKDAASLLTDSIANLVGDIKTSAENVDRTAEITTAGEEIEALLAASSAADSDARTVANAKQVCECESVCVGGMSCGCVFVFNIQPQPISHATTPTNTTATTPTKPTPQHLHSSTPTNTHPTLPITHRHSPT